MGTVGTPLCLPSSSGEKGQKTKGTQAETGRDVGKKGNAEGDPQRGGRMAIRGRRDMELLSAQTQQEVTE